MCCPGISFTSLNIKILGPRIGGGAVDDFADLIDGDGDGKCKERGGNFIPCPPRKIVEAFRGYQARVNELRRITPESDKPGRRYISEVQNGIDANINHLRGNRPNWVDDSTLLQLLEEAEERLKGKPKAPAKRNTPEARQERHIDLLLRANRAMARGGEPAQRWDELRAANAAIVDYRAADTDKKLDALENLLNEIERRANNAPNAAPAQQAAEDAESVGFIDVDAIIQERRTKAKEKAKKIAKNAKKFIPQEVRNFFQRRSINNMDDWVTGTSQEQKEKLDKWVRRMFENTFEDLNGRKYTVKLNPNQTSVNRNSAIIAGEIYGPDGRIAGRFFRSLDFRTKSVYHSSFSMNEDQRGNGVGSAFVRASEILYKKAGFKKINVSGLSNMDGYKGATHWPKMGFDWADADEKRVFLSKIQRAVAQYDESLFSSRREFEETRALLRRALQDSLNDPNRVLPGDLLRFKGAELHFQENGGSIDYKLVLEDV